MLKLSVFEFLVRSIPEVFIFVFAAYVFTNTKFDKKKYVLSSLILAICVFIIRTLPINYGVHTILNIVSMTVIVATINKIEIIKAIRSSIITAILLFISEGINIIILAQVFKLDLGSIDIKMKTITGLPSLVFFIIMVLIYFQYLNRRKRIYNA